MFFPLGGSVRKKKRFQFEGLEWGYKGMTTETDAQEVKTAEYSCLDITINCNVEAPERLL